MPYATSIRKKLESEGYEIEEEQSGELYRVRSEKDGKVHIVHAEELTVAFLEVSASICLVDSPVS